MEIRNRVETFETSLPQGAGSDKKRETFDRVLVEGMKRTREKETKNGNPDGNADT